MKVLYCVSEVAPIIKVGGLGDVAGSLPKALADLGVDIKIVVPKYQEIVNCKAQKIREIKVDFANQQEEVNVWQTNLPKSNVLVFLLENNHYLSKDGHVAFSGTVTEIERFAFFSKAIVNLITTSNLIPCPDLLHLNDWHTSLIPLLLLQKTKTYNPAIVLTIHNLSYQGIAPLSLLKELGLEASFCQVLHWDSQNRDIDILMEGIIHADFVNTVSPTYAKEIMTSEFGQGIQDILKAKEGRVLGILNGIDTQFWDPQKDSLINFQFSNFNFQIGKIANKKTLKEKLELSGPEDLPLFAFIGRLEPKQKGLDILYEALNDLLPKNLFQFILLGTGDREWEEKFKVQSSKFKVNMIFLNRFDEELAHQIYAGADLILVPSRFEPCGLPQIIGMRYGTLPLVRKTGGLADTVIDGKTGFVFENYSSDDLKKAIERVLNKWKDKKEWEKMVKEAMKQDFSWNKSAREYQNLYQKALEIKQKG